MIVFRFEHNRTVCTSEKYREGGESLTGHGPHSGGCDIYGNRPNFGSKGAAPYRIMEHERCAVTTEQFTDWITPKRIARKCSFRSRFCDGEQACYYCADEVVIIDLPRDWDLVAYELDAAKEDIDWRFDSNQVVFNPAFAVSMRVIDVVAEFGELISVRA
jgi:hypothetical protein